MMWRYISGFISINIILIILGFFLVFWKVESGAYIAIKTLDLRDSISQELAINIENYEIERAYDKALTKEEGAREIFFPKLDYSKIPIKFDKAQRILAINKVPPNTGILERCQYLDYIIRTEIDGHTYQIRYMLEGELRLFLVLFLILVVFEGIILYQSGKKSARSIRKTLKPLSELAETARGLNEELMSKKKNPEERHLEDLAKIINRIDANKLDSKISVDSSQNELKDLASAIDDMLYRVHKSYQSQIQFVSDASHELRTPISVIQGYANLLDRWGKNDEETMQESIDAIKSEAQSMKELVEQLLFLARGDNESIQFNEEKIDICELMDEIIKEAQMIDSNHKFKLTFEEPAYISGDYQLMKQVLRILVDNSIKYTPDGGQIDLRIKKEDQLVHIIVQDSGIGIDPKDLPYTFERFYRSDESRARKTGGSGLGLSIAKWIIEQHQGDFEILSRVNIGTRITITFPQVVESPEEDQANLS